MADASSRRTSSKTGGEVSARCRHGEWPRTGRFACEYNFLTTRILQFPQTRQHSMGCMLSKKHGNYRDEGKGEEQMQTTTAVTNGKNAGLTLAHLTAKAAEGKILAEDLV